ncbi:hypothetical protein FQR65_LT06827 [Abscondita terminalis]|nr:hypothetical protein FQR65_LT06827 [Abscondita terminalis]
MLETEDKAEYMLHLYRDTITYYEQLQLKLKIQHTFDMDLARVCYQKIEDLLNLELQNQSQSNVDVRTSLMLMQNQLKNLMEQEIPNNVNDEIKNKKPIQALTPRVGGLSEIAGLKNIKKILITLVVLPMLQPQLYVNQKVSNSILLYGPPGTGKTRLAHAIAAEASATFYSVSSSDLLSEYVGNTEKQVKELFEVIRNEQNCTILFMDEIDSLCMRREAKDSEWSRRLKTELMCQISYLEDCSKKYFICATNCPWDLDSAIIRRFQRRIYVPLPNREERKDLIKYLTKNISMKISPEMFAQILDKTEGYSGSDITDLIRNAINLPLQELSDAVLWEPIENKKYKQAENFQNIQDVVVCNVVQMPAGSIQSRPVEVFDIVKSLDEIKPTVPTADLIRYEEFSKTSLK